MKRLAAFGLCAAALFAASAAEAAVVTYSDRAAFETAIGGSNGAETFNSFAADASFQGVSVAANNMSILGETGTNGATTNKIDASPFAFGGIYSGDGTAVLLGDLAGSQQIRIDFTQPVIAWGADFVGIGDGARNTQVRFYSIANVLLGTLQGAAAAGDSKEFYGISLDASAAYAIVGFNTSGVDVFSIDNIAFKTAVTAVPVPGALTLFLAGIAGLGFAGRAKAKAAAARRF